jgi:hypothetical protein
MADDIANALHGSLQEQLPVVVYFQGNQVKGIVSRLETTTVELRQANQPGRIVVRLDRIDAVMRE